MDASVSHVSPIYRVAAVFQPWRASGAGWYIAWILHLAFWGCVLIALWQVNRSIGIERRLRSPWPMLHQTWLPLLVFLAYLLGWLSVGLWSTLQGSRDVAASPEVEAIWNEAQDSLVQIFDNASAAPLYLIVGPLTGELQAQLAAAGAVVVVSRDGAPLHVFADGEAVYVVAAAASLLGLHGARTTEPAARSERESAAADLLALERLRHLCHLLRRDRPAERAAQGVVLMVPFAAIQSDAALRQAVTWCREDLQVIRRMTELEVPIFVAFNSPDKLAGPVALQGWFQRFPLMPDLERDEMAAIFRENIDHLCASGIPKLVRQQMRVEPSSSASGGTLNLVRENARQYQFLASMRIWRTRLERLLLDGTCNEFDEPGLVAGCYSLPRESASGPVSPVFSALLTDLSAHRQTVAWTPERLAELQREKRLTQNGNGLVVLGWVGILVAVAWLIAIQG